MGNTWYRKVTAKKSMSLLNRKHHTFSMAQNKEKYYKSKTEKQNF
jgi:hypothetical protein